jgi:TonB-dependent SusC/RagA subfamily outer membrane receptor
MNLKYIFLVILVLVALPGAKAQNTNKKLKISGYVLDSINNPISGAMILVDNKNTGKVTNDDGFYKIKVKKDSKILAVFTKSGATTAIPIEGRTSISFILGESSFSQNEVQKERKPDDVLDTGYGVVNKDHFTQSADKSDVTKVDYSSYSNIYDLLRSKLPSVEVIGEKVYVRGISSLVGGTDPLFVVDGVIVESIDFIQPSIVKSVDVLKGSAASMYGIRGSNGVIVINTIK